MRMLAGVVRPKQWQRDYGGGRADQVHPIGDLREHITDGRPCWCGATENEDGVIVHDALDEREKFETGERKPS
jgi:hypothetical protein